jgi:hypothetical protein
MPDFRHAMDALGTHMGTVLSTTIVRLVVAALLGGAIGLERQLRHKPAGLRTNIFICFGAAMYTVLSEQLAGSYGGDHTRVLFCVDGPREDQDEINILLHQSSVFSSVASLGAVEHE